MARFMSLAKKLVDLRKERNLTQKELAKSIGVHFSHMSRYERRHFPPVDRCRQKDCAGVQWSLQTICYSMTRKPFSRRKSPMSSCCSCLKPSPDV